MKRYFSGCSGFIASIGFIYVLLSSGIGYSATCEQWVAEVASVQGEVEAQKAGEKQWQAVTLNDKYCPGDKIRVHERSRADLALVNQPMLRLDQNTTITLGGLKEEESTMAGLFKGAAQLDLIKGAVHFFSRLPRNLEVRTAFVNAGVEGTEFLVKVDDDQTFISVFEGKVLAANEAGTLPITSGQSAEAKKGMAPVYRTVVRPRDAVLWALYYPPVIVTSGRESTLQEGTQDPNTLVLQASQLLSVGRVDEAGADIERALSLDPQNSGAFALQSIIAVVQNEKDKALTLAGKAVEAGPQSATAQIALSYAQQAGFDLEGARKSVEKAAQLDSENALVWARLAELRSSFGELDAALEAAKQAAALNPDLSRTQSVLGFAYLTQINTAKAKEAFVKAIELDQADALPRLGLGLAKIRDGQLNEGRREIEIAASLDSSNALVRSYLGKAYYEEKREGLDAREFNIAKELDPLDPTPWFYSAIEKQTTNRPVEALQDLQKALELNDNRAVYRSKLMLDSDQAARSASLAKIYSDLGFQQRALAEGWDSANTDPTNYSAHRFLADSYSILPRHEIARVSELLQSQLLQPSNITPIQPQLAESNLFLISSGGAADVSFNEFNPLFNRDRIALQASGIIGEDDTNGQEAVISGIYKKASFSLGYSHFETDGWRMNADQEDDIANVFLQLELTPNTSIQAEYRYRDNERGDTQLRFFPDDFLPDLRQEDETDTFRLGGRHAFSPNSILLGNFSYQEADRDLSDLTYIELPFPPPLEEYFSIRGDQDAYSAEIEHLFRSNTFNIISGVGLFRIEGDDTFNDTVYDPFFVPPFLVFDSTENVETDTDHYNLYVYSYLNLLQDVTFTVGVSGDFFDQDEKGGNDNDLNEDQLNPKFGIAWKVLRDATLRGAVFRTLKRTLITDQTLEPTQVAGFNQFYDDINATDAWHYGIAVDQKISKNAFCGAEFFYRDLEVPYFLDIATPPAPPDFVLKTVDWEEYEFRYYLNWTPHDWVAVRLEYQTEKLDRDPEFAFNIKKITTQKVPLGISVFHPSGLSLGLKATYVDQSGQFERQEAARGDFEFGKDSFTLVDALVSYRLPKRYGFLTVAATNLFDKEFKYADTDFQNASLLPGRTVYGKLTLAFP